ncbi:ferrous iron transport protein B [Archaeoglobus profundus]|uniref:Ferrous iron transport protein B n=1 Tax=Archaeoglobus profundus (strain DSM 5631 / JCM 9629 / NBRC 100127 / Av18) TaxID=572546 RepID=D2RFZ8_ARCPA|nr:ferrous iron transport protein B [Archaeoglobus profundus]ADB57223.1 ferrous iron transport protein B [Archaeoglobus profundus DSM 5631]
MKVALVGNPNVGKTALINALTGGNFTVGNFPGVTVEKKEGKARIDGKEVIFIDLPGIYSLQPRSIDEKVARDFLVKERPDLILNVVNASNLERNLYLTLELTDFGIPMIVVLNMVDIAKNRGIRIRSDKLSEILGVPVVETVASKGIGIDRLKEEIIKGGKVPKRLGRTFEEKVKIAEEIANKVIERFESKVIISELLDEAFMDKHLGIPIFLSLMWMVFVFTYNVAQPIVDLLDAFFSALADLISSYDGILFDLLGNGVISGVGSVLVFLPNIAFLFISLSILELSGYMPRAVYLVDSIMSKFGLNGRSIIPLIMGFGCNVPAVMATRSIEDDRIRLTTVLVSPFMSCSARLPIYVLFVSALFRNGSAVIMSLYLFGLAVALISAFLFRKTIFKGEAEYILELPPYILPNVRDIVLLTWNRVKHFLEKAGTVIVVMAVFIWFITSYPSENIEESFAGIIGKAIHPLFAPMGWDYKLVLALIMGFVAKEVVVETIGLMNVDVSLLSTYQALAFMVFTLLYVPCFATIAAIRSEAGFKWAIFSILYSFIVAYIFALLITEVGTWLA